MLADDRHNRQEHRIARQLADGCGFLERTQDALAAFLRFVGTITHRQIVPTTDERLDLLLVQILQSEMRETRIGQNLAPIANDAARHDDARFGIIARKAGDLMRDAFALFGVKDFV